MEADAEGQRCDPSLRQAQDKLKLRVTPTAQRAACKFNIAFGRFIRRLVIAF